MKKILLLLIVFFAETRCEELRGAAPDQLVTYVGQQKFKVPNQPGLTGTYTIATPGIYVLSETIQSSASSGQVISITSSNVTLDLAGFTITLLSGSGTAINGITIAPNLANIIIRNGTISNMNGHGILIGSDCTHVKIEDVVITECTVAGISFAGLITAPISECELTRCKISKCNAGTATTYGLKLSYCDFFTITNCTFNENKNSTASINSYGLYAANSRAIAVEESTASGTVSTTVAAGFYLDTACSNCTFKNCAARLTRSTATTASGKAYGFYMTGNTNNRFENCISSNNSAYGTAAGFYAQNSSYNCFIGCTAVNNFITGTTGSIGGFGFLCDTATCEGNYLESCSAYGNKGSTIATSFGVGFSLDNSLGCSIIHCTAQANDGVSGTGIGIQLKTNVVRCYVQDNTVVANTSSTLGKAYGIWDASNPSTTLLTGNVAFANRDETASPTNQNYVTSYNFNAAVQSNPKNSLKTLSNTNRANTDITP